MDKKVKELYTTQDVAKIVGVSARTIQLWSDMGLIKVLKTPGGHRRIHDHEIKRLLGKLNEMPLPSREVIKPTLDILVVEDDLDLQKLYEMEIASWGKDIKITCVADGYEALIMIGEKTPDVIITDLHMPNLDGFHMLDILSGRKALENTKVIVVTGISDEQIKLRGPLNERFKVFPKPVSFEKLKSIIVG